MNIFPINMLISSKLTKKSETILLSEKKVEYNKLNPKYPVNQNAPNTNGKDYFGIIAIPFTPINTIKWGIN